MRRDSYCRRCRMEFKRQKIESEAKLSQSRCNVIQRRNEARPTELALLAIALQHRPVRGLSNGGVWWRQA
ncbi:hypothetical protein PanWU01x14_291480 [Parasponia andersonii]|uniref:Uncharacterized protein n=1 Tax=Parasponia andersonii TaxID=3476 RepID=A0A2P5AX88_PARAD|nr:hypothetical protein PanWU01x14_291480 [Parasponia andersonii]